MDVKKESTDAHVTVGSESGATMTTTKNEQGFLEAMVPDVDGKSVAEVEELINELASNVTLEQVNEQDELLEQEVASMKQFMDKAVRDGVLVDNTDEDADDGTILLKNKTGDYNPIADLVDKRRKELDQRIALQDGSSQQTSVSLSDEPSDADLKQSETVSAASNATSGILKAVIVHVPISGSVPENEILRYASAAVQDCLNRGEAPFCPLLQSAVSIGCGKITDEVRASSIKTMVAFRQFVGELRVYVDCDRDRQFEGTFTSSTVLRSLNEEVQKELAAKQSGAVIEGADGEVVPIAEKAPDKSRVNRFTRDADGKPVREFENGVAGYSVNGRPIPIVNDGATFDPKIPNVLGDMKYRNELLSTPTYDPKDWYYRRFNKIRFLVVAYMGPKNCNVKYKDYYMCVFGAAKDKSECKSIYEHVKKRKNCYHGKMFSIGVVDIGQWFATAPPRFAKDATASYANPLHREYMDSYINEQKRATVELEQRVLDDELRARNKTNTLMQQLKDKNMNPDLAPTNAQVQKDIAAQRSENARKAAQHKRLAAEAARRKEAAQKKAVKRGAQEPIGPQTTDERPRGLPPSAHGAKMVGGTRRAVPSRGRAPQRVQPAGALRGRGRGRGRGGARGRGRGGGRGRGRALAERGVPIDL